MAEYDWILGLGVAFFIAGIMTIVVSYKDGQLQVNGKVFFFFLTIGLGISVYSGLIDFWYFVVSFLFSLILVFYEFYSRGN